MFQPNFHRVTRKTLREQNSRDGGAG